MIKQITDRYDNEGFCTYYQSKNPLFADLPQYHFDRREMEKVFDSDFALWLYNHANESSDDFSIMHQRDEWYIIHFPSGTIVNWYKHIGRTNTCNKPMTIEDLKEFKKMLLDDFGYEEVCDDVNTCVCCGRVIPEGRQVCPNCESSK